jgi:hypothetical protein
MPTTQGASTPNPVSRLTRTPEGLLYTGDVLTYRIASLQSFNLDRMRLTLKAHPADTTELLHIDSLDLYNARGREAYAEACFKYLKAQPAAVMLELSQLIKELETERIAMRDSGAAATVPQMSPDEEKAALAALRSKDLLKNIAADFDAIGFIGERINKLLAYFYFGTIKSQQTA